MMFRPSRSALLRRNWVLVFLSTAHYYIANSSAQTTPCAPPDSENAANSSDKRETDALIYIMKVSGAALVFLLAMGGGMVPLSLSRWFVPGGKGLSYANCASAGILLGASLVHLLSDAEDMSFDYPLAHLFCGVGFFLAFILEKILFAHEHEHPGGGGHGHGHGHGHAQDLEETDFALGHVHLESSSSSDSDDSDESGSNFDGVIPVSSRRKRPGKHNGHDHDHDHDHGHGHGHGHALEKSDVALVPSDSADLDSHDETNGIITLSGELDKPIETAKKGSRSSAWMFFAVVSLESMISGSAMGIASKKIGVLVVWIAIVTHIWAESFALAATIVKCAFSKKEAYRIVVLFSAMTPMGTFLGMGLGGVLEGYAAKVISATLMAFAAGTFLYVAIVELIAEEFESQENKWTKLNFMLLGFAFMTVLAVWL